MIPRGTHIKYTDAEARRIIDYANETSPKDAARKFGLSAAAVRGLRNRQRATVHAQTDNGQEHSIPVDEPHKATTREDADGLYASAVTGTIQTLDQLLKACKVDLNLWRVDRHEIKTYQGYRRDEFKDLYFDDGKISGTVSDKGDIRLVTMFAVKAWLVRREEAPYENALEKLAVSLGKLSPRVPALPRKAKGDHLLIPAFFDSHFGRLTMDGAYTTQRAKSEMIDTASAMISRVLSMGVNVSEVLFPVGNDGINVDNLKNTTTRGTWQEMSGNVRDAALAYCEANIEAINRYSEIAPVDVVIVEGNHDRLLSYMVGLVLGAYFKNNKRVKVDSASDPNHPRKYREYGVNLIGMEHGDRVKPHDLALIMANEQPEMWARTKYRTFLRGHFHQEREVIHSVHGTGAVQIVTFPAFCPPDEWEAVMGYLGTHRAAEARLYHREHGPAGMFPVFVDELRHQRQAAR